MNEPFTENEKGKELPSAREQEISAIADNIPGLIDYIDSEGRILYANKQHEEWFGVPRSEIVGKHYSDAYPAAAIERIKDGMELLRAGKAVRYEAPHPWARPTPRWVWANYVPDLDDQGKLKGFFLWGIDITERKQAEEALRVSEEKFRALIEHSSEAIGLVDAQGMRLFESPAAKRILGYSDHEILSQSLLEFVHPDEVEHIRELWVRLASEPGASQTVECRLKHKDGSWRWVEATATNLLNIPAVHAVVFNYHDITERKRAEDQIRFQASLLDQVTNVVAASDLDGKIIYWNRYAEVLHGWKAAEVLGKRVQDFLIPLSEIQRARELMQSIVSPSEWEIDLRMLKKDGNSFPAHVNYVVMKNTQGEPIGILGVSTDITERKQAEEQIDQYAARLQILSNQLIAAQEAERRTIARELHDEIGQVLTAVSTGLQGTLHARSPATRTKRLNETIALVDQTWNRIRTLALDLRPSMLDDFGLVAALDWYLKQQAERSGFKSSFVDELPSIRFEQNLETTAFRVVQIVLTNVARHAHAKHVALELSLHAAHLEIVIRDDGVGFDVQSALDRAAHGISMGLSSLQERVRLAGGELEIQSSPGQGTEIRARFPIPERK